MAPVTDGGARRAHRGLTARTARGDCDIGRTRVDA
jgi:hypothetical protein